MNFLKKLIIVSSLLLVMISPANTINVLGDDPSIVTYSTDLTVGDVFTWNVVESSYFNGTAVTETSWVYEYLEGDVITVEIVADLADYDPFDYALDAIDFFGMEVNEELAYFELSDIPFVLPIEAEWDNGTTENFVYWMLFEDYGDDFASTKIEGDEVVVKEDFEYLLISHEEIRYNKNTGLLNYYHYENDIFDVKFTVILEGYSRPSSEAPFSSIWYIAAGLLAIPVMAKFRRKD
jgi:hypothetical protein